MGFFDIIDGEILEPSSDNPHGGFSVALSFFFCHSRWERSFMLKLELVFRGFYRRFPSLFLSVPVLFPLELNFTGIVYAFSE